MSVISRIPHLGKIAALSTIGGSFYYLRNDIQSFIKQDAKQPAEHQHQQHVDLETKLQLQQPRTIDHLPENVPYLLVGAGTASHAAMRAIRVEDPKAKVLMIGAESYGPYMRPALSKELWMTEKPLRDELSFSWINGREKSIFYEPEEFFLPLDLMTSRDTGGVSLITDTRLTKLDPDKKIAHLETGQTINYDKCLIAPGAKPKIHPQLQNLSEEIQDRVVYFRSVNDFKRLEKLVSSSKSVLVIGGGELGTGLANSLTEFNEGNKPEGQVIYNIFPESGNLAWMLPVYLSEHVTKVLRQTGTQVITNADIKQVTMLRNDQTKEKRILVELTTGQILEVDCIVCATGWESNVELAKSSGLEVDEKEGGYLVNSELVSRKDIWVAGDAMSYFDTKFGRRKVASHDHAIFSGARAGQNMAAGNITYTHQPVLYCDIGTEVMMETVGIVDSKLKTVAIFANYPTDQADSEASKVDSSTESKEEPKDVKEKVVIEKSTFPRPVGLEPYEKGVVFYLKDDIIVGILLWNVIGRLTIARRILHQQQKYDDLNEVAKLFNLYLDD